MTPEFKPIPIKTYWYQKVLLPVGGVLAVLMTMLISTVIVSSRISEEKNTHSVLETLAMIVAEPILIGDNIELIKRVATVARHHSLSIRVTDLQGKLLVRYPEGIADEDSDRMIKTEIHSTDGRDLGSISAVPQSTAVFLEPTIVVLIIFFVILGALLFWIMLSLAPIIRDISALTQQETDSQPPGFRFAELDKTYTTMSQQAKELSDALKNKALMDLSRQVAHDIRSPLSALHMATLGLRDLPQVPEETRVLIRSAASRITDIANSLIERHRKPVSGTRAATAKAPIEPVSTEFLSALLERIVSEKRVQFRGQLHVEIALLLDESSHETFAVVQPQQFARVVSNLVDNAVEAIEGQGKVEIKVSGLSDRVRLMVSDNGRGIEPEVLPQIGQKGATFGKANGSGLGVHHAKRSVESWSGRLSIESCLGVGTCVTIELPKASPPAWFLPRLSLLARQTVVILDDDSSIHQIWKKRFEHSDVKLEHFSAPEPFEEWVKSNENLGSATFLCDYELIGFKETGLDLIEKHSLQGRSILVTSHFDDERIQKRSLGLKIPIVPKARATYLPILIREPKVQLDSEAVS